MLFRLDSQGRHAYAFRPAYRRNGEYNVHLQGSRSQGLRALLLTVALFTAVPSFGRSRSKPNVESQSADQLTVGPWRAGGIPVLSARTGWILNLPLGDVSKSGRILLSRAPAGTIPNRPETLALVTRRRPARPRAGRVPPATVPLLGTTDAAERVRPLRAPLRQRV